MIVKAYPPRMTPEQFEEWSGSRGAELIDGVVRQKKMGSENGAIQTLLSYYLNLVVVPGELGRVLDTGGMYQGFPARPKSVRKPDISFIRQDRLPDGRVPRGICTFRPDIAAEVISPNDTCEEVAETLADYFDAGGPLIWVGTPKTRTVLVYQADGTDDLIADPIVPGFKVQIAELFPTPHEPPAAVQATPTPAAES